MIVLDPSLKEGLINSLLTNSELESCRSQPSLENSKPQICYSQPQLDVNNLQSSNMQSLLHTSQPQIVYSRPQVDTNIFQPSNTQSVLHASQPQLGVNNLQSSNSNNQNQLSVRKSESISQSDSIIHTWKSNEEDLLVSLRHDKNDQFTQTKNHSLLWKAIAEEINKTLNCNITSTQAMNKYFSLKKKWKEVVDAGTGTEAKFFRQKNDFDQLYGTKASTKPQFLLDSTKSPVEYRDIEKAEMSGDLQPPSVKKEIPARKPKESKSRIKRRSTEIVEMMERQNTEFHERMEQHHQAKMTRMDRFLDLYEKDVNSNTN